MQVTSKRSHERTRQVKPQTRGLRAGLKRTEQPLGGSDSRARVADIHDNSLVYHFGAYRDGAVSSGFHGALAVLDEIQKDLEQTLPVRPHGR